MFNLRLVVDFTIFRKRFLVWTWRYGRAIKVCCIVSHKIGSVDCLERMGQSRCEKFCLAVFLKPFVVRIFFCFFHTNLGDTTTSGMLPTQRVQKLGVRRVLFDNLRNQFVQSLTVLLVMFQPRLCCVPFVPREFVLLVNRR